MGNNGDIPKNTDGSNGDIGWAVHTQDAKEKQARVFDFLYSSFDSIGPELKYFGGNQIMNPTTRLTDNGT